MDRFIWSNRGIEAGETKLFSQVGVRIYDGDQKTSYDDGNINLTSHKLTWIDSSNSQVCISLHLSLAVFCERHAGGIGKSAKVSLHLQAVPTNKPPGPVARSSHGFVRFAFKHGGDVEFTHKMQQAIHAKNSNQQWCMKNKTCIAPPCQIKQVTSIFTLLFQTVKFKSYLLSLGIPNPVTKQTHGSGTHYHQQLAHEVSKSLAPQIDKAGGMILLTDAYCRINRARGMELLSPEDLLNACRMLTHLNLSIKLRQFDTGVMVLQSDSHSDEKVTQQTTQLVTDSTSLSSEELASIVDISVLLAKERLLLSETSGLLCRDDSDQGLRFFPNLFASKAA
nr:vacuolar protein-sorting-associated protein 36-like [Ciona intestinalis]|eukprot:XP_026694428.1 vacuolar protein-sorting-associated protein 36-like [Ciona intestinalis]